ncbi:MAG: hypothetical protein V4805_02655 [Pseudomonadota bacterium]
MPELLEFVHIVLLLKQRGVVEVHGCLDPKADLRHVFTYITDHWIK